MKKPKPRVTQEARHPSPWQYQPVASFSKASRFPQAKRMINITPLNKSTLKESSISECAQ